MIQLFFIINLLFIIQLISLLIFLLFIFFLLLNLFYNSTSFYYSTSLYYSTSFMYQLLFIIEFIFTNFTIHLHLQFPLLFLYISAHSYLFFLPLLRLLLIFYSLFFALFLLQGFRDNIPDIVSYPLMTDYKTNMNLDIFWGETQFLKKLPTLGTFPTFFFSEFGF